MTANAPPSASHPVAGTSHVHPWIAVLVSTLVACAVFGFLFWEEIVAAIRVWSESTAYNHCFLVLPLTLFLLWTRRRTLAAMQPSPQPWALVLVPLLSGAWLLAALLDVFEAEQLVMITLFEALLLAVLGWRAFKALLAPLLFLYFLVPFGAFVVPLLQQFTAKFTIAGLQLLGIPVYAEGFFIQIPEGSFEIAEACAGLRFLIASIVFGCFFATIVYRSPLRRVVFIALSVVLPVIANGFRALGILVLAHLEGSATAVATDHVLYGWIFFALVTLLLIILGMLFADRPETPPVQRMIVASPSKLRIGATMVAGLVFTSLGPASFMAMARAAAEPIVPAALSRPVVGGWTREDMGPADWRPMFPGAGHQMLETYRDGAAAVTRAVAVYRIPARANPLTRVGDLVAAPGDWRIASAERMATLPGSSRAIDLNAITIVEQSHRRLVWWFYVVGDRMTASTLETKLLQTRAALLGGPHTAAIVALSTNADDPATASAVLRRFLEAEPLWRNIRPAHLGR
jgi:exosortase A